MKQYSYKDIKLFRSFYKTNLDLLYDTPTQERIDRISNLITVVITAIDLPQFADELNSSGDIQLTASLQILRVKCGMYKQFQISTLANAIDVLLASFSKQLKNYNRKINKEPKLEINVLEFYAKSFCDEYLFFIYVSFFKLILKKFQSDIQNQSKLESTWVTLISNLVNTLKRTSQQKGISTSVKLMYELCSKNTIYRKEVVKNGIVTYLVDFIERCQVRWLVLQCLKLIRLLTEEKQIAKLLLQQKPEHVLLNILNKFKTQDTHAIVTGLMDNITKYGESENINNVIKQAKEQVSNATKNTQKQEVLSNNINNLKLYSLSDNFTKYLSNSVAHKWLGPLLSNNKIDQKIQISTLQVFQSMLRNKEAYKNVQDAFNVLSKPMLETIKAPKSFEKLNEYLRALSSAIKKDIISKEYIKKNNVAELIEKFTKKQEPVLNKLSNQVCSLIDIKQGKGKSLVLDANRKSKDIKQLQKLNNYLDQIVTLNLYDQVKKEQLQILSDFLDVHQSQYQNQNQQQTHILVSKTKSKILDIIKQLFSSKAIITKLSSQKLLNNLIESLKNTNFVKETLQMSEVMLHTCNNLNYPKDKAIEILQKIQKNNALNEETINSCGEILYYMNSIDLGRQLMKKFKDQYKNNQFLQRLTACLSTIPDQIQEQDYTSVEAILDILNKEQLDQLSEELLINILLLLIRISKISNDYKLKIRTRVKLLTQIKSKLNQPSLNVYILELFTSIIGVEPKRLNTINYNYPPPHKENIEPTDKLLIDLLHQIIQTNKYTNMEIKYISQMVYYDEKYVVENVKVKTNQSIYQSGELFAIILEKNGIQSKKLPMILQETEREILVTSKNLMQALIFLSCLKEKQNIISASNTIELIKVYSSYTLAKYELYPIYFDFLNLALKVLYRSVNNTQSEHIDYSGLIFVLQELFKIFYSQKKAEEHCDKDRIIGSESNRQQTIQNIYACYHAISKKYSFKFKQNDVLVKYAENGNNPYIMYRMGGIVQNLNFDELKAIKSKLKFSLIKYPKVKHLISFDKKYAEDHIKNIKYVQSPVYSEETTIVKSIKRESQLQVEQQQILPIGRQSIVQSIPKVSAMNQSEKSSPSKVYLQQPSFDLQTIISELTSFAATGKSKFNIEKIVDSIEQKNQALSELLIKIYLKCDNNQFDITNSKELKSKIMTKLAQQNIEKSVHIFEILERTEEAIRITEKIKLTGEKALEYACRIFKAQPSYASRIIQYNLLSEKDFQYIEDQKIPQLTYEIFSQKFKEVEIGRYLALMIGTASKSKNIQTKFYKQGLHLRLMESIRFNIKQSKVVANSFYALAGLAFCLQQLTKLITTEENINSFIDALRVHQKEGSVIESGSCLLSNLCYHNQHAKKVYSNCGIIDVILKVFKICLDKKEYKGSTFKQMLRVLGNSSLLVDNAKKMVSLDFVPMAIVLIELVNYNQDLEVLKYIVEVFSNLSSHTDSEFKLFLAAMFKQGIMDILLTLLETQILNADIIAACIDSIDGLCQDKQIQKHAVDKRLIPLLIDILKSNQWNQKTVIKGIRVVSNLTLDRQFIIKVLQANFSSIIANIISNRKLEKTKLSLYTMKIITRIFNAKIKPDLIVRSGYIDCVLESLKKQTQLFVEHLDILIFYAKQFSEFISKKTFQIVVPLLEKFLYNEVICKKCIILMKLIDRDVEVQHSLAYLVKIYMGVLNNQKDKSVETLTKIQQLLTLLIGYCSKSHNLRAILRQRGFIESLVIWRQHVNQQNAYLSQAIMVCLFVILNNYMTQSVQGLAVSQSQEFFKRGIQCKMYRRDSSSKKAMINMTNQYQLRGFKYPDGQIKDKYRLHLLNIKDYMFGYQSGTKIWQVSVFGQSGGIFEKSAQPKNCCTIIGPVTKNGAIIFNLQFATQNQKQFFERHLVNLVKHLRQK